MTARQLFLRTTAGAAILMAAAGAAPLSARQAQDPAKPVPATIPVRVEVTMSRYQGEKKVSSLPFTLLASAGDAKTVDAKNVSMRMGIDVPIGNSTSTNTRTTPTNSAATATQSTGTVSTTTEYRSVGTNIDCRASRLDETRFSVYVNVNDSSIYSPDGDAKNLKNLDPAAFRTFSTSNTVVLREGQTVLFGTGTDKISGEVLKIEVTLTVVK